MGRLYNVKGWLEPYEDTGESLMKIVEEFSTDPIYKGLAKNWTLSRAFGFSDYVFFGATAKHADIMVEDVVGRIVSSNLQVDGYFECEDEEDENNWSMRVVNSRITKFALPYEP